MSSCDFTHHQGKMHSERIVKPDCQAMITHIQRWNKDRFLHGVAAKLADFSKFGGFSGPKYGEAVSESVCVCGFEEALLALQLIDFDGLARPVMYCIEQHRRVS